MLNWEPRRSSIFIVSSLNGVSRCLICDDQFDALPVSIRIHYIEEHFSKILVKTHNLDYKSISTNCALCGRVKDYYTDSISEHIVMQHPSILLKLIDLVMYEKSVS